MWSGIVRWPSFTAALFCAVPAWLCPWLASCLSPLSGSVRLVLPHRSCLALPSAVYFDPPSCSCLALSSAAQGSGRFTRSGVWLCPALHCRHSCRALPRVVRVASRPCCCLALSSAVLEFGCSVRQLHLASPISGFFAAVVWPCPAQCMAPPWCYSCLALPSVVLKSGCSVRRCCAPQLSGSVQRGA